MTGGSLVYVQEALGKMAGFLVGWMVWVTYLVGWAILLPEGAEVSASKTSAPNLSR